MLLLVDTQGGEQCSSYELFTYLRGPDAVEARLVSGDVAFAGNGPEGDLMVGIEVKKVADLVSSISTGRLSATQGRRMMDDYQQRWLLLIGHWGCDSEGQLTVVRGGRWTRFRRHPILHYSYVAAYVAELQTLGFHYHVVASCAEAAHWVKILARWWDRGWDKHRGMRKFDESGAALMPHPDAMTDLIARMAKALPNFGYERAMAAAAAMSGPEDIFTWSPADWAAVPGVGTVIAARVWGAIHGRRSHE